MEQMQAVLLYPAKIEAAVSQSSGKNPETKESGNEFRKLMEQQPAQTEQTTQKQQSTDTAQQTPPASQEGDEMEPALMELAAMQMMVMQQTQPVQTPEQLADPTGVPTVEVQEVPVMQTAELPQQQAQPLQEVPEAEPAPLQKLQPEQPTQEAVIQQAQTSPQQQTQTVSSAQSEATDPHTGDSGAKQDDEVTIKVETADVQTVFGQVEATPVKVSDIATAQPTEEAQPVEQQLETAVRTALAEGETRVEVQLNPEHLGKVTVELVQHQDGSVQVLLHAESQQTRAMLEGELSGLTSLLTRSGQQTVQVEVSHPQQQPQQDLKDGHHQQQQQNPHQQRRQQSNSEDFLHQLRLGLIQDAG